MIPSWISRIVGFEPTTISVEDRHSPIELYPSPHDIPFLLVIIHPYLHPIPSLSGLLCLISYPLPFFILMLLVGGASAPLYPFILLTPYILLVASLTFSICDAALF